jgi:tetratricopeptide (TPR) repeat protein
MNPTTRSTRFALLLVPIALCAGLVAAAPPHAEAPEDVIRRANDAFRAGDTDAADKLYATAEERTADPGLVAFNRAAVLFERGQFRDAEVHYERVLKDAACPADRAARAWYNRGTCLLRRGGSWEVYRAAVACFEHTLDSPAADDPLKADARHNAELAKLLCSEERKKEENKKKSPNDNPPPEEDRHPRPDPDPRAGGNDPNSGTDPDSTGKNGLPKSAGTQPQQVGTTKPNETETTAPGANPNLEVLSDKTEVQALSERDARANLAETAKRIKREQQSLLRSLYGPDRSAVRDW